MHTPYRFAAAALLAISAAAFQPAIAAPDDPVYTSAVASPLRDDDRKGDDKRKPAQFLDFAKVRPGMKALDLMSGGGATAQLLALAVGKDGAVWAQNGKESPKLKQRMDKHPQANLHAAVKPIDNPVPEGAPALDLVTINMSYHDVVNNKDADRGAMNKAVFNALKPGGIYVVIDNAAKKGSGLSATNTIHRIEDAAVIDEVTKAGFVLDAQSEFLHVPGDPREEAFYKMTTTDDKFALRFVKK